MIAFFYFLLQNLETLLNYTGLANVETGHLIMILFGILSSSSIRYELNPYCWFLLVLVDRNVLSI